MEKEDSKTLTGKFFRFKVREVKEHGATGATYRETVEYALVLVTDVVTDIVPGELLETPQIVIFNLSTKKTSIHTLENFLETSEEVSADIVSEAGMLLMKGKTSRGDIK